ncbi:MAG: hypothetical protein NT002_10280 [candidate division Zixibacteria bacterium]|nr:hypothetical protein [candidate division Zixibacteria bacterium]
MSKVKKQIIADSTVKNGHRSGTCPKMAARPLQNITKTKKRTPPAPPAHSSLTSCPTNKNAHYLRGNLQGLLKSLPVSFPLIAPVAAPNPGQANAAYILKIEETNPFCHARHSHPTHCFTCILRQNQSIRNRPQKFTNKTNFVILLVHIRLAHFWAGLFLFTERRIPATSCGVIC